MGELGGGDAARRRHVCISAEAYGPRRGGRLMSFLYIWQTLIQAPLVVASGAIGFSHTSRTWSRSASSNRKPFRRARRFPDRAALPQDRGRRPDLEVSLDRRGRHDVVDDLGRVTHFSARMVFDFPPGAWNWSWLFFAGLSFGNGNTIYTYLGYYHICNLGAEIRQPRRTSRARSCCRSRESPCLYLAMADEHPRVLPWRQGAKFAYIVSTFVERLYGAAALAAFATVMILWIRSLLCLLHY